MPRIKGPPPKAELRLGIEPDGFLDARDLMRRLGISKSQLYAMLKEDKSFPPRYKFSSRKIRWKEDEIAQWEQGRIQQAHEATLR